MEFYLFIFFTMCGVISGYNLKSFINSKNKTYNKKFYEDKFYNNWRHEISKQIENTGHEFSGDPFLCAHCGLSIKININMENCESKSYGYLKLVK